MAQQQTLPLDGAERQEALWLRVPEDERQKVVEIFARLLACAVRGRTRKEDSHDDSNG